MTVQVTDAKKNLASFPKMVQEGNDVFLSKRESWIKNTASGVKIPMRLREGGTPEFDLWIKRASQTGKYGALNVDGEADIADRDLSGFQRLEELI